MDKLVLHRKSRVSDVGGAGEPPDAAAAKAWVETLNAKWPDIYHWTAPPPDDAPATKAAS